jgi:hypothetical protein
VLFQGLMRSVDVLHQQGWGVNVGPLVKRIWRNILGERGLEEIVVPLSELAKVNPAWADSLKIAQQMQQAAAQAGAHPKTSISLKGDLDPMVSKELATGQPVSPGPPGPTASTGANGAPGPMGATSTTDAQAKLSRVTAAPSAGQALGGI